MQINLLLWLYCIRWEVSPSSRNDRAVVIRMGVNPTTSCHFDAKMLCSKNLKEKSPC